MMRSLSVASIVDESQTLKDAKFLECSEKQQCTHSYF